MNASRARRHAATESYYGHPYFLCTLLNFGGQQGLTGNVPRVLSGVEARLCNRTDIAMREHSIVTARFQKPNI